jgi:hypothetical protein
VFGDEKLPQKLAQYMSGTNNFGSKFLICKNQKFVIVQRMQGVIWVLGIYFSSEKKRIMIFFFT